MSNRSLRRTKSTHSLPARLEQSLDLSSNESNSDTLSDLSESDSHFTFGGGSNTSLLDSFRGSIDPLWHPTDPAWGQPGPAQRRGTDEPQRPLVLPDRSFGEDINHIEHTDLSGLEQGVWHRMPDEDEGGQHPHLPFEPGIWNCLPDEQGQVSDSEDLEGLIQRKETTNFDPFESDSDSWDPSEFTP
jgi:hypothetical protein